MLALYGLILRCRGAAFSLNYDAHCLCRGSGGVGKLRRDFTLRFLTTMLFGGRSGEGDRGKWSNRDEQEAEDCQANCETTQHGGFSFFSVCPSARTLREHLRHWVDFQSVVLVAGALLSSTTVVPPARNLLESIIR